MKLGRGQQDKAYLTADRRLSVTNCASHGHGSRTIVDGGVQAHESMSALQQLLEWSPKTSKIAERDRHSTHLVASSRFASC